MKLRTALGYGFATTALAANVACNQAPEASPTLETNGKRYEVVLDVSANPESNVAQVVTKMRELADKGQTSAMVNVAVPGRSDVRMLVVRALRCDDLARDATLLRSNPVEVYHCIEVGPNPDLPPKTSV